MKSLISLWQVMAQDAAIRCHTCTDRDLQTVKDRVEHEGLSFLTITLPNLATGLQKGLEQGFSSPDDYPGFRSRRSFPEFLQGLFGQVFSGGTGLLLDDPSPDAIQMIRQLSLAFQKLALECSDDRIHAAFSGFIECEKEVRETDRRLNAVDHWAFKRMSSLLFGSVFDQINRDVDMFKLIPKHGPGATAEKIRGNAKFLQRTWTQRLEKVFPFLEYALPNARYASYLESVDFLEPGAEIPVRVITVPKTLKTPRIIAIEPVAMQYMQQAIQDRLYSLIPDASFGMIGFTDQEVNNHLARLGSIYQSFATLDLTEASDRVSNQLVRTMLSPWPSLLEAVDATRSRRADVPGYGVQRLAKFASMGSALCFPVEAMVFLTCVFLGLQKWLKRPMTAKDIKSFAGRVRVYGDDIIVPTDSVDHVIAELEHFGALVNRRKSYWNGEFRESCGKEYFRGSDVSITRFRRLLPTSREDAQEVVSLVKSRNLFYKQGMWFTAGWIDAYIEKGFKHFPIVGPNSPVLGRETFLYISEDGSRLHPDLHYPMVRGYRVKTRIPLNGVDDVFALQKFFLKDSDSPSDDKEHLERSGRPDAVDIKLGWGSLY